MAFKREAVIRSAEKYVSKGKIEAAIKEYRKVLKENPTDANTLNRVGDLYARVERYDEAVRLFTQIAEQYTQDGFFVKAIAIYKKIIKLDPTSLQVYEKLAALYAKQGLVNEARTQYQVLADYYQKHDNAASAITIYQRMTELEPENPSFRLKLAELYASRQLVDKAIQEYRRLADIFVVNGSLDEAAQVYLQALALSAEDLDFIEQAVRGLHDGGNVAAAVNVLARATELNPAAGALAVQVGLAEPEPEAEADAADQAVEPDAADETAPVLPRPAGQDPDATLPSMQEPSGDDQEAFSVGDVELDDDGAFTIDLDDDAGFDAGDGADGIAFDQAVAAAESVASEGVAVSGDSDVFTFELDLDDDEVPESLVTPPPDMLAAESDVADQEAAPEAALPGGELDDLSPPDVSADDVAAEPLVELEVELDEPLFDDLPAADAEAAPSASPSPAAADDAPKAFEIDWATDEMEELDLGQIEVEVEAEEGEDEGVEEPARRAEDLLAEAQVFAKYGLQEKAEDRLRELRATYPQHGEGLLLLARMRLEAARHSEVVALANELSLLAAAGEAEAPWATLRGELEAAGFALDGERVVGEPGGAQLLKEDRISQLLDELDDGARLTDSQTLAAPEPVKPPPPEPTPAADGVDAALASVLDSAQPAAPAAGDQDGARRLVSLADELALDELEDDEDQAAAEPPPAAAAAESAPAAPPAEGAEAAAAVADPLDETGMSWLDEVGGEEAPAPEAAETIFDDEDDFFDLAAELERELTEEEGGTSAEVGAQAHEQSLEEIVEGFKKGVAEHLSPEDFDTHFNLGIAYREMGLLDEAIGEFQLASKDPRYLVESSSMLGMCFLDKGLPELAVKWYRKGLESPSIREEETLGLLYDMGTVYLSTGNDDAAYRTLVEIYGINSNYRDVASRLEGLAAGREQ